MGRLRVEHFHNWGSVHSGRKSFPLLFSLMFRLAVGLHDLLYEHKRGCIARHKVAEASIFHAVFKVNKEWSWGGGHFRKILGC
jgi:hypothetical protein